MMRTCVLLLALTGLAGCGSSPETKADVPAFVVMTPVAPRVQQGKILLTYDLAVVNTHRAPMTLERLTIRPEGRAARTIEGQPLRDLALTWGMDGAPLPQKHAATIYIAEPIASIDVASARIDHTLEVTVDGKPVTFELAFTPDPVAPHVMSSPLRDGTWRPPAVAVADDRYAIELAEVASNAEVLAMDDGVVADVSSDGVVIDHAGSFASYSNLSGIKVAKGAAVRAGDTIASIAEGRALRVRVCDRAAPTCHGIPWAFGRVWE